MLNTVCYSLFNVLIYVTQTIDIRIFSYLLNILCNYVITLFETAHFNRTVYIIYICSNNNNIIIICSCIFSVKHVQFRNHINRDSYKVFKNFDR